MIDLNDDFLLSPDAKSPFGSGYGLIVDFLVSTTFWTTLQIVFFQFPNLDAYKMNRSNYLDFRNRMVSFVHGMVCLSLSAYHFAFMRTECGQSKNHLEYFTLVMSGGYFSYDFLGMAWFNILDLDMAVHHALCVAGIIAVLVQDIGCGNVVMGLFVSEVSNPSMHVRILLRHMGKRYTKAYEVAEYIYFGSFFVGRIIIGHPVVYDTVVCAEMNILARFVCLGILFQSYLFLYRMYFILRSRMKETSERNEKGIKIHWLQPMP